jgi:hypothetical protein
MYNISSSSARGSISAALRRPPNAFFASQYYSITLSQASSSGFSHIVVVAYLYLAIGVIPLVDN